MKYVYILLSVVLFGCNAKEPMREISNYDDCILEAIKGAAVPQAVALANTACASKFLGKSQKDELLTREVLDKVRGQAYFPSEDLGGVKLAKLHPTFSANLFNGNEEYVITQLTIGFFTKKTEVTDESKPELRESKFNVDVKIKPLTSGSFEMPILPGNVDNAWTIESGRGYKLPK